MTDRVLQVAACLLLCSCATFSPVTIARELGSAGWFQADGEMQWQRLEKEECLLQPTPEGQVIVLVHGSKGDGNEINALLPALAKAKPAALLLYRWVAWDNRDGVARGFAAGISHLLRCAPWADGQVVVIAHSAGGIVVGHGATGIVIPPRDRTGPALFVLTVASPLAGLTDRPPNEDGRGEVRFLLDWGTYIQKYPVGPLAMAAVHLRTQFPADPVMKPTAHHAPNDPNVGIPGARHIDLPAELTHDGSLIYVVDKVVDGTWRAWFD